MEKRVQLAISTGNLVVAKYRDGRMIKGITHNFGPRKRSLSVITSEEDEVWEGGRTYEVFFADLKAVFFVKSLEGRKASYNIANEVLEQKGEFTRALKVKVIFLDGETILGTTQGYDSQRTGFFVSPLEEDSNNVRIFVILDAVQNIEIYK